MKKLFMLPFVAFTMVKFDTQDQIYSTQIGYIGWRIQKKEDYLVKRESLNGKDVLRIHTKKPAKWLFLAEFNQSYKVKKINQREFVISCKDWQSWWNRGDMIQILFIH